MADRGDLMEAALEVYPEELALLDAGGRVVFWNRSAEAITGFARAGVVGRTLPQALEPLVDCRDYESLAGAAQRPATGTWIAVHARHAQGHDVAAMSRKVILRDDLGERIGTAAVFHPAERTAALPHGETSEGSEVRESQAELQDRLEAAWELFAHEASPWECCG